MPACNRVEIQLSAIYLSVKLFFNTNTLVSVLSSSTSFRSTLTLELTLTCANTDRKSFELQRPRHYYMPLDPYQFAFETKRIVTSTLDRRIYIFYATLRCRVLTKERTERKGCSIWRLYRVYLIWALLVNLQDGPYRGFARNASCIWACIRAARVSDFVLFRAFL